MLFCRITENRICPSVQTGGMRGAVNAFCGHVPHFGNTGALHGRFFCGLTKNTEVILGRNFSSQLRMDFGRYFRGPNLPVCKRLN